MDTDFAASIIINASLLLSVSIVYNVLFYSLRKRGVLFGILLGLVVGLLGIFLMMNSVVPVSGIIFDTRSILVSVSGLFFGLIPTVIAAVIICIYRIILDGPGQITGVLVTVLTAGVGLIWHHFRFRKIFSQKKKIRLEFYLFSLITHVIMLACMFTLPRERISAILGTITLPVLIIYPLASTILCMVIFFVFNNIQNETDLADSELRFRTTLEQAPIGIAISDNKKTLYYNAMYEQIIGRKKEEIETLGWKSFTHPDDLQEDVEKLSLLWDGNGYPQGLRGKEIPVISRILCIVDSYDAMTQDRSYRKAMSKEAAIIEIRQNAGTQFDPELSEIFINKVLPYEG